MEMDRGLATPIVPDCNANPLTEWHGVAAEATPSDEEGF
jgi:hypothetical protein